MNKYSSVLSTEKLAIFLFHGVIDKHCYTIRNYNRKHIEAEYFESILIDLKKHGKALTIDEVYSCFFEDRDFPKNSYCITFDDGFENNFTTAAPILRKHGIPAIFYVSTDFIQNDTMSWIDRIEYCLENTSSAELRFTWTNNCLKFNNVQSKIKCLEFLRSFVKRDKTIDLEKLVDEVFYQCNTPKVKSNNSNLDKKMNWDQVGLLNSDPLFSIGGHSHEHINLGFLDETQLDYQISMSMKLLKEKANINTIHYAYPEGLDYCYSPAVIKALQRYGVKCCPTAIDGVNSKSEQLFNLKRITVI